MDADDRARWSLWLLLLLAAVLLPAWIGWEIEYLTTERGEMIPDVVSPTLRAMFNPWLPAALALAVGLRAGVWNLSLAGGAALGAVVCGILLAWEVPVGAAVTVALIVGGAAGLLQGLVGGAGRLRPAIVTLIGGLAVMTVCRQLAGRIGPLDVDAFDGLSYPGTKLQMLVLVYGLVVMWLWAGRSHRRRDGAALAERVRKLSASPRFALTLGGALAAAAGCVLLAGAAKYEPIGWVFGDLRVLAAVVLCGPWRRSGEAWRIAMLPVGMLVATMWMQTIGVWLPGITGAWPVGVLIVLVAGTQWVVRGHGYRFWRRLAWGLTGAGVVIVAFGAYRPIDDLSLILGVLGAAVWGAGLAVGVYRRRLQRRRPARPVAG